MCLTLPLFPALALLVRCLFSLLSSALSSERHIFHRCVRAPCGPLLFCSRMLVPPPSVLLCPYPSMLRAMTPDHAANAWDPLRHSKQEWISTIHHGAPLTSCMPGLRGICLLHFRYGSDTGRAVLLLHHDCFYLQAGMHVNSELSAYASSTKHVTGEQSLFIHPCVSEVA